MARDWLVVVAVAMWLMAGAFIAVGAAFHYYIWVIVLATVLFLVWKLVRPTQTNDWSVDDEC